MANRWYKKAYEKMAKGELDLETDAIEVHLVRGYTENLQTHEFLDDVTGAGGTLAATIALGTRTITIESTFLKIDAADVTWTSVGAGAACDHIIFVHDTGASATSPVLWFVDVATNLPVTPNGGNIALQFSTNGVARILDPT